LVRPETSFYIIERNIERVSPGSEVEIYSPNQLDGVFGTFKEKTTLILRSKSGFVIASSQDIEDLAILVVEYDWFANGPEILLKAMDVLS
jgi:hypothetical protein